MLNEYFQSEIIGVTPRNYAPTDIGMSLFVASPLRFDTKFKPGLETFTGNISASLGACLIGAVGKLGVSPTFMKLAMQEADIQIPDNQLRNQIDLSLRALQEGGVVENMPNEWILNDYGQVFKGSFWRINTALNGQMLKGSMAYDSAFSDLPYKDDFAPWAKVTGLKVKDPVNTRNAIDMIQFLGNNPERKIDLSIGTGRAKDINPKYQGARRLMEAGLVRTIDGGTKIVAQESQQDLLQRLARRIDGYNSELDAIPNKECSTMMDVDLSSCLGISENRWAMLRSMVNIYTNLRAQNNQNN
jgi:hypothetical protein